MTLLRRATDGPSQVGVLAAAIRGVVSVTTACADAAVSGWRRVAAVVEPLGWVIAGVVCIAFVVGYLAGWTEFVAIAWTGLVVLLLAAAFLIGRSSHEATMRIPLGRVVVGDQAAIQLTVTNPTRRRLGRVRVEVPVGESIADFAIPGLAVGARFEDVFVMTGARRGVVPIGPVRTIRADPIGLVTRERRWDKQVDLFVHPRTISIPSISTGFVRDLEGIPTSELTASDLSFHSLREYVPGDERRAIHWKSTAKTGQYMVRQFEETRRSHLMIVLGLHPTEFATDEEFEMAVSVAGSLGTRAIADGREVAVVASAVTRAGVASPRPIEQLSSLSPSRLLDDLCRVDPAATALRLGDVVRFASDGVAGVSLVFLVCGSTATASSLSAASANLPAGVAVVAVVCDPEIVPSMRRVGDLTVLTIGFLDDLGKTLLRAGT
ncbi:uncharacterized protein DUF58 [Labedella gwakjiensis]|uniref:DUF58 domain-containing protein n=1 Tax=Labedella gwakjiensis TaxID=390269 RepID=A0A2P8GS31_9MICO|nr:DUF58 domain-containing protein [Labedella gwakjiensis]PSL36767.1 uncharacterized protein DUF58 [Labedella gwakjiensis]RUQ84280.1 DUF58 domain-containing protein [Labedella gwakjiensis]